MEVNRCGHASNSLSTHWVVPRDGMFAVDNLKHLTTMGTEPRFSSDPVRRLGAVPTEVLIPAQAVTVSRETRRKNCVNDRE